MRPEELVPPSQPAPEAARGWGVGRIAGTCVLLALTLRAPFLLGDLESDEAGLLLVVRGWGPDGSALYGDYWVDRPPLLIGYYWLADLLPGSSGVRLLGCVVAALLVTCAVVAGSLLGGRPCAWSGGIVAAALSGSYIIGGHMVNGMLQGAALVMAGCCAIVAATAGRPRPVRLHVLSALAGVLGASAAMVKQNLVGALVFAVVVLLASRRTRELSSRQVLGAIASFCLGAVLTMVAVVGWTAAAGVDRGTLWYALYEFRLDAAVAISEAGTAARSNRGRTLLLAFVATGAAMVVVAFLVSLPRLVRAHVTSRYVAGVVAMLAVAVVGIAGGGSWWSHYLLQLVPAASLMAALGAVERRWRRSAMQAATALAAVAAVVGNIAGVVIERQPRDQVAVGRLLATAAQPGDTAFVAYGNAEVLLYSGMHSPYPHLWSLPVRVLDPDLEGLLRHLRGPRPPTWIVQLGTFDAWGVDPDGELAGAVERRYRQVAAPCGVRLHLLRGTSRQVPHVDPCG